MKTRIFLSILFLVCSLPAGAGEAEDVRYLQQRWAEIKYQVPETQQAKEFEALVQQASGLSAASPDSAEILIWEGIIRSTYAGARGGLGALREVKKARALFERAIELKPEAMQGSAYTSLGSLYYQVPGFPVGFGSNKKADAMLKRGLEYNPDGIDSNYFYGDFLFERGRYEEAVRSFEKALQAAPRPGRQLADEGRKAEIEAGLEKARAKLGNG
jgi:tetratricopeptide (TPR) repeat protein